MTPAFMRLAFVKPAFVKPALRSSLAAGFALTAFLAGGCAVGPNHKAPKITQTEEKFRGDATGEPEDGQKTFADLPWWNVYRDPTLFSLIKEVTENSFDLRIALARVEAARQAHRAAIWGLWPTIRIGGGAGDAVGAPSVPTIYPPIDQSGNYGLSASASWEPDVWGRLRRIAEARRYDFEAADEERRGVYVSLVGDVAELYFYLGGLDLQQAYAERAVATRRDTLKLFQERSSGGVGNDLEVSRAKASLAQAEAAITQITLLTAQTENQLSFLLARAPSAIPRGAPLEEQAALPEVPVGLPSTLLQRRPDVRASEKQLLAANAAIGAQMADFFPKFELTGFLGAVSPDLSDVGGVRGGAGLFSWTLPFLGGEKERAEYDAAIAMWKAATAQYERVAVGAFRDVANALAAISTLRGRRAALDQQLAALAEAEQHAISRYRGGVANYLDVLTAQEQLLAVQLDVAAVKGQERAAVARLYRTLGGGWPLEEAEKKTSESDGHTANAGAREATRAP